MQLENAEDFSSLPMENVSRYVDKFRISLLSSYHKNFFRTIWKDFRFRFSMVFGLWICCQFKYEILKIVLQKFQFWNFALFKIFNTKVLNSSSLWKVENIKKSSVSFSAYNSSLFRIYSLHKYTMSKLF